MSERSAFTDPVLVLTAWVSVNPVSRPAVMEPIDCVRKTDYDALYTELLSLQGAVDALRHGLSVGQIVGDSKKYAHNVLAVIDAARKGK